jgi:hypothetical protein
MYGYAKLYFGDCAWNMAVCGFDIASGCQR